MPDAIDAQAQVLEAAGRTAHHVIDVGAFRGDVTARYLEVFPQARVWTFEPTPDMVELLRERFRHEPRVTIVAAAVGDTEGRKHFDLNDAPATNSLLAIDPASSKNFDYPVQTIGHVEVDVVTLDSFSRAQGLGSIAVVKLDVQGAALEVVKGAASLLDDGAIDLYFTEMAFVPVYSGQTEVGDLLSALTAHRYRLYDIYNVRHSGTGQFKWCDGLFLSPEVRRLADV